MNINHRTNNDSVEIIGKALTFELPLKAGTASYNLDFTRGVENEKVVGIMLRNHASAKFSQNGAALCTAAILDKAHIKILDQSNTTLLDLPLETFVNGPKETGAYTNVDINKFSTNKSKITLGNVADIIDDTVIEITFIYEYNCPT